MERNKKNSQNDCNEKEFTLNLKPTDESYESFEEIYEYIKKRYKNKQIDEVIVKVKDKSDITKTKRHEIYDVKVAPTQEEAIANCDFHFIYEKIITRKESGKHKRTKIIEETFFTEVNEAEQCKLSNIKPTKKVTWEFEKEE